MSFVCVTSAKWCWSCRFDYHHDREWHTWADTDDVEHALAQGLDDPSNERCACDCAEELDQETMLS